jgi:hypothetical protein
MILVLVLSGLLGDVGPRRPQPVPPPPQCTDDSGCVLTTFQGCCGGCCPQEPRAVPVGSREEMRCAAIDCAMPDCAAVRCGPAPRPVSEFVATCRAGRCVALPKTQVGGQCRVDLDCRVVVAQPPPGDACHRSACGCCPVSQAVPVNEVVPLQEQRPAPTSPKTDGKPNFGLSTGDGRPAPQCSPCPAPQPTGGAACLGGRCVLTPPKPVKVPVPRPPRWPPPVG